MQLGVAGIDRLTSIRPQAVQVFLTSSRLQEAGVTSVCQLWPRGRMGAVGPFSSPQRMQMNCFSPSSVQVGSFSTL